MTAVGYPLNAVGGAPAYTGRALRAASLAPLLAGATAARPLGARSGVRPGTPSTTVSVASMTWSVAPHAGILDVEAAAEAGPYGYAITAAETGSVNAAHATYARWDGIYVQLSDPSESDGTSTPGVAVVYVAGTPSASPAMPTQPARSLLLGRIVVPQSGGGSPSVVWLAPPCGLADGVPWFATEAERDAAIPAAQRRPGIQAVIGQGAALAEYIWSGSAWELDVEYGSHATNGQWAKFRSGLLICWINTTSTLAINNAYGPLYQGTWTWTFPAAFASPPGVAVGELRAASSAGWATVNGVTVTSAILRALDTSSRPLGTVSVSAVAIGRWR